MRIYFFYKLITLLFFFIFPISPLSSQEGEIKSIIIGHLYPIMDNEEVVDRLFKKIKKIDPDYIFILGDSKLQHSEVVDKWKINFNEKVYFAPGNNEIINGNLNSYKKNVGYLEKLIDTPNVNFLIANTNDNKKSLIDFIEKNSKSFQNKHTILLVHHRIWDDTLTSMKPYQHDKSYYLKDIFPILNKYINTIFAGNSKHQYFYDDIPSAGNQNMNNIYWLDRIGDINAYSVGIGTGNPKLGFIELISTKKFPTIIIPHHITTGLEDPIPVEIQNLLEGSIPPEGTNLKLKDSISYNFKDLKKRFGSYRRYISKVFYFLSGSLLTVLFLYFKRKKI